MPCLKAFFHLLRALFLGIIPGSLFMVLLTSFKGNSASKNDISIHYYADLISSMWVQFEIISLFRTFLVFLEFILTEVLI